MQGGEWSSACLGFTLWWMYADSSKSRIKQEFVYLRTLINIVSKSKEHSQRPSDSAAVKAVAYNPN
eukprot:m.276110 g.276110  ORF g.276110 m.276110 type:complete len:66 (-) comp15707_c2_seq3:80-277(-)